MAELKQLYNIRIGKKNNSFNLCLFRSRETMEAAEKLLNDGLAAAFDGKSPYVSFKDDFGYSMTQDMREVGCIIAVGLADSAVVNNEVQYAAQKGQMHLMSLIESDPQLKAFLKLYSGRGSIIAPNGAGGPAPIQ